MGNQYKKVRAGDPFEFPALLQNDLIDLIGGLDPQRPGAIATPRPGWVRVKNQVGRPLSRYCGFRLAVPRWDFDRAGMRTDEAVYDLVDITQNNARYPVAVLQEPIGVDKTGWAAVDGLTVVRMSSASIPSGHSPHIALLRQITPIEWPGNDARHGSFAPSRSGGELSLIAIPPNNATTPSSAALTRNDTYALAVFQERGAWSDAWTAGSAGNVPATAESVNNSGVQTHLGGTVYDSLENFTGWQRHATTPGAWRCKRPGVWKITTQVFAQNVSATSHLHVSTLQLQLNSDNDALTHWGQLVKVPQAVGSVSLKFCWVDFIRFVYDEILYMYISGDTHRMTGFATAETRPVGELRAWGKTTFERVTDALKRTDADGPISAEPPEPV